jgi:hypothetical protein
MAALPVPFCSACLKELPAFDIVLTTACHHLYCSDCIERLDRCPIDAIAWGVLDKHDALLTAFEHFRRRPEAESMRKVFALINTKNVMCKLMGTRTHLGSNCPYRHKPVDAEAWECQVCGLENETKGLICVYCSAPKQRKPKFLELDLLPARSPASTLYWLCDYCCFENDYSVETCWGCMRHKSIGSSGSTAARSFRKCGICGEVRNGAGRCLCSQAEKPMRRVENQRKSIRTGESGFKPRSASPILNHRIQSPVRSPKPQKAQSTPYRAQYNRAKASQSAAQMDYPLLLTLCALLSLLLYALFAN